jgi:hypothetical protein
VASRRARTQQDPIADVIASCADQLEEALSSDQRTELTVAEYAAKHRRADVTVRHWCMRGQLPSRRAGRGYLIPADAKPPVFSHGEGKVA